MFSCNWEALLKLKGHAPRRMCTPRQNLHHRAGDSRAGMPLGTVIRYGSASCLTLSKRLAASARLRHLSTATELRFRALFGRAGGADLAPGSRF